MKKHFVTIAVLLWGSALAAQVAPWKKDPATQSQNQHQSETVNSGNTQTNSHNVSDSATGGNATGGTSSASSTAGANVQGGNISDNTNIPRQTASAYAPPAFHTSPCVKAWGAGAQAPVAGLSIGGGKIDKGCDIRETAEEFRNAGALTAFCKTLVTEPSAIKAGVTFADCIMEVSETVKPVQAPVAIPVPQVAPPVPQIIVPPAQVTVNIPPWPIAPEPPAAPQCKPAIKHRKAHPCPTLEK